MYLKIFEEIVDILQKDYAGHIDKWGWDTPDIFREQIENIYKIGRLDDYTFIKIVNDYLLDFKDQHIFFISADEQSDMNKDIGFKVRRYKDALYVIEVLTEDAVNIGDKIVAVDGYSVYELSDMHERELMEEVHERQKWEWIIEEYETIYIEKADGENTEVSIRLHNKEQYKPVHRSELLNNNTLKMTFTDFFSPEPVNQVIEDNKGRLKHLDNLIIDVRVNNGGSGDSFEILYPYLFPKGRTIIDDSNSKMSFNITERTADLQIDGLQKIYNETTDEKFKNTMKNLMEFFDDNRGKGFVSFNNDEDITIEGQDYPKNIIILSDVYCGSAGDVFVELMKWSDKVTVIGRSTAGLNDYSNLIYKTWNDKFTLYYPTSRMDYLDQGKKDYGVQPDIHIEWTPEHLKSDMDLKAAFECLKESGL